MKSLYKITFFTAVTIIMASSCGSKENTFDATGFFDATEVTVSSEANGRIVSFDISEGQNIYADEILGCIDSVQLYLSKLQIEKNIEALKTSIPNVNTQTASLKEQIKKQKFERDRVENIVKSEAAPRKQLDDINSAISVMEEELKAAESNLENNIASVNAQIAAYEMQLAQIKDRLAKCMISSPIDGTVLSKYAQAGELATAGKPLFKVADTRHLYLRAYFTLSQLSNMKIGQKVKVMADFGGNNIREYDGTITWISEKSEFTPKSILTKNDRANLVYAVKISIENDGYVKIGMYGEVIL